MIDLDTYSDLKNIPRFGTVRKKITSSNTKEQRQDYLNQLVIAQMLNHLPAVEVQRLEKPHDIVFQYKDQKYACEVKTIHRTEKKKIINQPPFVRRVNCESDLQSFKGLSEIPSELKKVADTIRDAYQQLKANGCFNIIFLCSDAWWINDTDVQDVLHQLVVRFWDEKSPHHTDLQAVIFYSDKNYLFENPRASNKMHPDLINLIQMANNISLPFCNG